MNISRRLRNIIASQRLAIAMIVRVAKAFI